MEVFNKSIRCACSETRTNETTIQGWYRWVRELEEKGIKYKRMPKLPEYTTFNGKWYFTTKGVKMLVRFKIWKSLGGKRDEK